MTVRPFGPLGRLLFCVSKMSAVLGVLVFVALVTMSIVSILGRKLAATPVPGDMEILQMAAAFASTSFFAYCHLNGGDMKVDFFTARLSTSTQHRLDAIGSLLMGLLGWLLTWRSGAGCVSLYQSGETSMVLGWPVWVAYALMLPGFFLLGLAGFYMAGVHWRCRLVVGQNKVLT